MKLNAFALAALLAAAGAAQEPPRVEETVSVGYVMIPFTVVGEKGRPVTDLRERDVRLFVDGRPVRSDMFEKSENAPVSFTVLVDTSGSMGLAGKMDAARSALGTLLAHRKPGDEFALYAFDDRSVREVVPFTSDTGAIFRALERITPFGKTAFFDALAMMPERSRLGKNPSRAVILLSDGIDNASNLTRQELARRLQGVSVPIYPLGLREPAERKALDRTRPDETMSDIELLDEIATLTGGRLFLGTDPKEVSVAVDSMLRTLRAQYLIGFTPTGKGAVKYRRISLRLAGRGRSVRVRAGYLGTEPPSATTAARGKT